MQEIYGHYQDLINYDTKRILESAAMNAYQAAIAYEQQRPDDIQVRVMARARARTRARTM